MPRLFVFFCFLQSCGGIAFHDQICKTIYFHRLATMRWRGVGLQGWGVHPWLHEVRIPPCLVCTCTVISTSVPHYGYKITSRTDQPHIHCGADPDLQMWRKYPVQRPQRRGPLQPMSGGKTLRRGSCQCPLSVSFLFRISVILQPSCVH